MKGQSLVNIIFSEFMCKYAYGISFTFLIAIYFHVKLLENALLDQRVGQNQNVPFVNENCIRSRSD